MRRIGYMNVAKVYVSTTGYSRKTIVELTAILADEPKPITK